MRTHLRTEAAAHAAILAPLEARAQLARQWGKIKPAPIRPTMPKPRPAPLHRATMAAILAGFVAILAGCGGGDACEDPGARDCAADPVQSIPAKPDRARSL